MQQGHQKPKKAKKVYNTSIAWIVLGITLGSLGSLLFLTSKPPSVRYIASCKPLVVSNPPEIEASEEAEPEIKEEELIQMTQPK